MTRLVLSVMALAVCATADAGWRQRRNTQPYYQQSTFTQCSSCTTPAGVTTSSSSSSTTITLSGAEGDGLDEVNARRIAAGLRPYIRDESLFKGALACAAARARDRLFGRTESDFRFLPADTRADAAGCAAYHSSIGWASCCVYGDYTYAGAAWVTGSDNRRYMQLFVRK